jgi:hypothetical protein
MKLDDWDIWDSYLTYFIYDIKNLESLAETLVKTGFCKFVFHSNTSIWWKDKSGINQNKIITKRMDHKHSDINVPKELKGYIKEVALNAAKLQFYEKDLFSDEYLEYSYIRAYLDAFYFMLNENTYTLYPQLKIYDNGVIILSFRISGTESNYEIANFVKKEVKLQEYKVDQVIIPTELVKILDEYNDYSRKKIWDQFNIFYWLDKRNKLKKLDSLLTKHTKTITDMDIVFNMVSIDVVYEELPYMNLIALKDLILSSLEYLTKKYENKNNRISKIGSKKSSIYLTKFEKQPETIDKDFLEDYGCELAKIMAQDVNINCNNYISNDYINYLGKNFRTFSNDYALYMNTALTLLIYSKKGINTVLKHKDQSRDDLIFEKQVQIEPLNYLYMCHKRLAERSSSISIPRKSILKEHLYLLSLEEATKVSKYGEINEFYDYTANELDWKKIRDLSKKNLEIRSEFAKQERDNSFKKLGLFISIIFGLSGITPFANNVITPIFQILGVFQQSPPVNSAIQQANPFNLLVSYLLAAGIIIGSIIALYLKFLKKHE